MTLETAPPPEVLAPCEGRIGKDPELKNIYREVTGVLLAGGRSRRFGRNKALAQFQNRRMIEHVLSALAAVFPKVLVATNTPEEYRFLETELLCDEQPYLGPLGGILSALRKIATPYAFVVACDMPLLNSDTIRRVVAAGLGHQAAVPCHEGGREYLMALYAQSLIPDIEASLSNGTSSMRQFCAGLGDIRWVPIDAESAANINSVDELQRLESSHAL